MEFETWNAMIIWWLLPRLLAVCSQQRLALRAVMVADLEALEVKKENQI